MIRLFDIGQGGERVRVLASRYIGNGVLGVAVTVAWLPAKAQEEGASFNRPALVVTPRVSVSERYSNNAKLASSGQRSDFITQVSPGINIVSSNSRLKGSFDYALNVLHYANGTSANQKQNALSTSGIAELVDGWAFLDFSGNISQQSISAFGTRAVDNLIDNSNSTETRTYRISPYLRGLFAGSVDYEVRLNISGTNADADAASDMRSTGGLLRLNGRYSGPLGWGADATSDKTRYTLGRAIDADVLRGRLTYAFNPQLNGFLSVGRESNNFSTVTKTDYTTSGVGLTWDINQRTKLAGQFERRSFGNSHNISFEHRTPLTAWRFSDSQDVANSPTQSGAMAIGTLGDLLYSQFETLEPDPARRTQLVNNFLLANGYNANTPVLTNFLASSASLQRRQSVSFSLLGVRDTINVSVSRGSNRKLDNVLSGLDDLSTSSLVQQSGWVASYSHRLTPDATLSIQTARQNTSGDAGQSATSLRTVDIVLSGRLGKQVFASVGARRAFFDSATVPYSETAFTGNLSVRF